MKRVVLIMAFILGSFFLYAYKPSKSEPDQKKPQTSSEPLIQHGEPISLGDATYLIYFQRVDRPETVQLLPNFTESQTTSEIMSSNNCAFGVNAGYYTEGRQPLGLFYTNENFFNPQPHNSALLNGFVYQTLSGDLLISQKVPRDYNFIFQTGPFVSPGLSLNIYNDEPARRVLIGQTTNSIYFLTIVFDDNNNSGPLLADVPIILASLDIPIITAINLDGGSASAFYSQDGIRVGEITPVGSFLCGYD